MLVCLLCISFVCLTFHGALLNFLVVWGQNVKQPHPKKLAALVHQSKRILWDSSWNVFIPLKQHTQIFLLPNLLKLGEDVLDPNACTSFKNSNSTKLGVICENSPHEVQNSFSKSKLTTSFLHVFLWNRQPFWRQIMHGFIFHIRREGSSFLKKVNNLLWHLFCCELALKCASLIGLRKQKSTLEISNQFL